MVTISKAALLGILLVGMLLGGGIAFVASSGGGGSEAADAGEDKNAKSEKRARQQPRPAASVSADLSPKQAASELGSWLDRTETDEDFDHLKKLVSKAAEWSAEDTVEQAMLIEDPYKRREALKRVFNYWIGSEPDAALAALEQIDNVALRRDLYQEAMNWLSNSDPQTAVALLRQEGNLHDHGLWSRSFSRWARKDREGALAAALEIEHPGMRERVLESMAGQLAEANLAKTLEWAAELPGESGEAALAGALEVAARSDPEAVVALLEKIPEGRNRRDIIRRAADEWAESDPGSALEWAESLNEDERIHAIGEIAESVLETDPDHAQEIADLLPDSDQRREVIQRIARLRAAVDASAAIEWLDTLPEGDRSEAWSGVAREWARVDPEAAANYASSIDDPVAQKHLAAAASYSWAQQDPAEAALWASTLDGRVQSDAMNRIVDQWAREKPADAATFVSSALEGELQSNMTRQVVGRWLREDTTEASAWIDTLPDGQTRDSAVYTLVSSIEQDFPEIALQWADTIGNEKKREYTTRRLLKKLGE